MFRLHTAMPRFHPTPAGFSSVIPQRLQMIPLREMAHTSEPTDTERKPQCWSVCGGTLAALGRNCQWEPSGKVLEISLRTAKRCWLSSAQIPARPTLIALKVTPAGASTCCQASPHGFCLLMPYRKNTMPLRATVHTWPVGPTLIPTNGWSLVMCSQASPRGFKLHTPCRMRTSPLEAIAQAATAVFLSPEQLWSTTSSNT